MTFSDEDLKRLKDYAVGFNKDYPSDWLSLSIVASIARLEAAEYALIRYSIMPKDQTTSGIREAVEAWRKAAGK